MSLPEETSLPLTKHRVLVVEDNVLLTRILTELFQLEGFHVETAGDGDGALTRVRERGPFDLVLCDVLLPGMRGTDVVQAILREHPRTGVILWSGHPEDACTMEELAGARFLQKPLDANQLLAAVAEVLAARS